MAEFFETIQLFLEAGGNVLIVILLATMFLWTLIFERTLYFYREFPKHEKALVEKWQQYRKADKWTHDAVRTQLISEARLGLMDHIPMIKTLVALAPLLGLLGTVTGMISVFDVMAVTGTGNARLMASGISMATIPTMAGMVAALSGLYFGTLLESAAKNRVKLIADKLS